MGPGQLVGLGFTVDFLSHVGLIIKILFLIKRFCLYADYNHFPNPRIGILLYF